MSDSTSEQAPQYKKRRYLARASISVCEVDPRRHLAYGTIRFYGTEARVCVEARRRSRWNAERRRWDQLGHSQQQLPAVGDKLRGKIAIDVKYPKQNFFAVHWEPEPEARKVS